MCWKSVLQRFPSWRHSSEHFPWGQMAPSLREFNGERRQLPYLWSEDNYHNPKGHKCALKVDSIHLTKINNLAFHPPKECTGLVWPFCAAFHSRTPVKMFSRARPELPPPFSGLVQLDRCLTSRSTGDWEQLCKCVVNWIRAVHEPRTSNQGSSRPEQQRVPRRQHWKNRLLVKGNNVSQAKKKTVHLSPVPAKSGLLPTLSCGKEGRGIHREMVSVWQAGIEETAACSVYTHIEWEWEKEIIFKIRKTPPIEKKYKGLLMGKGPLWQSSGHWRMGERVHCKATLFSNDQLFWREYMHTGLKGAGGWNICWHLWWPRAFFLKVRCYARERGEIECRFSSQANEDRGNFWIEKKVTKPYHDLGLCWHDHLFVFIYFFFNYITWPSLEADERQNNVKPKALDSVVHWDLTITPSLTKCLTCGQVLKLLLSSSFLICQRG